MSLSLCVFVCMVPLVREMHNRRARPSSFLDDGAGTREHRLLGPCGGSAEDLERLLRGQALATRVFLKQLSLV